MSKITNGDLKDNCVIITENVIYPARLAPRVMCRHLLNGIKYMSYERADELFPKKLQIYAYFYVYPSKRCMKFVTKL